MLLIGKAEICIVVYAVLDKRPNKEIARFPSEFCPRIHEGGGRFLSLFLNYFGGLLKGVKMLYFVNTHVTPCMSCR